MPSLYYRNAEVAGELAIGEIPGPDIGEERWVDWVGWGVGGGGNADGGVECGHGGDGVGGVGVGEVEKFFDEEVVAGFVVGGGVEWLIEFRAFHNVNYYEVLIG